MTKFSLGAAILLVSLTAQPTLADQTVTQPEPLFTIDCAGQFECVISQPLTAAEVRISLEALKLHPARNPNASIAEARCDACKVPAELD